VTDNPYLTRQEMAERCHTTPRRISEIVRDHKVPVLRAGKVMLFDERAITAFEDACRVVLAGRTPTPPTPPISRPSSADAVLAKVLKLTDPANYSRKKKPPRAKARRSAK